MFDKTIKIEVNKVLRILTNEEVKKLVVDKQNCDEMQQAADSLRERLDAANAKLTQYGHMSGF